jgi:predicted amidohydrolase
VAPRRRKVRVAAAAYPFDPPGSFGGWGAKIAHWVADAAGKKAELLVFPEYGAMELSATGRPEHATDIAVSLKVAAEQTGEADKVWTGLAQRHKVHIVAAGGPRLCEDGRMRNVSALFAPSGASALQEKMILTPWERAWGLASGRTQRVFDTALCRLTIAICYDSEFPLLVRARAEAGAELVLVPTCTDTSTGYHRVRSACLARALECQSAVVLAPTTGDAAWCAAVDSNVGAAGVYLPADRGVSETGILAEGRVGEPGWCMAGVDLAALRAARAEGEVRTFAHWPEQQGAAPLVSLVEVVSLQ